MELINHKVTCKAPVVPNQKRPDPIWCPRKRPNDPIKLGAEGFCVGVQLKLIVVEKLLLFIV